MASAIIFFSRVSPPRCNSRDSSRHSHPGSITGPEAPHRISVSRRTRYGEYPERAGLGAATLLRCVADEPSSQPRSLVLSGVWEDGGMVRCVRFVMPLRHVLALAVIARCLGPADAGETQTRRQPHARKRRLTLGNEEKLAESCGRLTFLRERQRHRFAETCDAICLPLPRIHVLRPLRPGNRRRGWLRGIAGAPATFGIFGHSFLRSWVFLPSALCTDGADKTSWLSLIASFL